MITHGRGYLFGFEDTGLYEYITDQEDRVFKVAEDGEDYV